MGGRAQAIRQVVERIRTFLPAGLDGRQNPPRCIYRLENNGYQRRRKVAAPVPQLAEQGLGMVRDSLERRECQKTAGSLDRMDRAKDAGQQSS